MRRPLNYKHLHYFWAVARAGGMTRAAERLHLTPQTLSGQIKQLEASVGAALFIVSGKRMELTEAGRVAYSYADEMFSLAAELSEALNELPRGVLSTFRVGIAQSVPKSIAHRLLAPAAAPAAGVRLVCREADIDTLLAQLALHRLHLVLSTAPVPPGRGLRCFTHTLGTSAIGLYAPKALDLGRGRFPRVIHGQPLLLPADDSPLRLALLAWCERERVVPRVVGEFDDTALMKAFAREGTGIFPAPLAIRAEIERNYACRLLGAVPGLAETYHAISGERRIGHPSVRLVVDAARHVLDG